MWKKITAGLVLTALMFGPSTVLLGVALLSNAAQVVCLPGGPLTVGHVPDSLTATTTNGSTVTLDKTQLTHAATIVTVGAQIEGVGKQGATIALMAALTESSLRMLANTAAYPSSASYPHDGNGGDHDSLGLFQMRPSTGWGTLAQLMDPSYQAQAFFGGPSGPNHGSPRGLLDIPSWQQMTEGEAAQSVEVSAYPDRYANYQPVAEAIIAALARTDGSPDGSCAMQAVATGDPGPDGDGSGFTPDAAQVATMIAFAEQQLGKPYVLDGAGPNWWDCSGLTMMAYRAAGVDIGPHSVPAQLATMRQQGRLLPYQDRERGDLIFWQDDDGGFPHVAIYLGHDTILAAPQEGENVKIQPLWSTPAEHVYGLVGRPTGTPSH
jgi:cell wall-associated NlpC family hydrolase